MFIYKGICWICRSIGIKGGVESWIAGFIGGFIGFGDSKGVSGSVNNQICLYLFARYVAPQIMAPLSILVHFSNFLVVGVLVVSRA